MAKKQTPPVGKCCSPANQGNGWYIDKTTKHWMLGRYDSGIVAEGKDGHTPYIGENENWWINGEDTGKPSRGLPGDIAQRGSIWHFVDNNTEVPPEGSAPLDIVMNTFAGDVDIANTEDVPEGGFVEIVSTLPFEVTPVLGTLKGNPGTGTPGNPGPPGSHIEDRYAVNGSWSVPPEIDAFSRSPEGWSTTSPTGVTAGQYVWISRAYISHTNALIGVWGTPQRLTGIPGAGARGLSTFRVLLYQRANTEPSLPSEEVTYNFETGAVTGVNNGWSIGIPADNGLPCWVTAATASGTEDEDIIQPNEWAGAIIYVESGTDGINTATIYLYQRTETNIPPPLPSQNVTYTFDTGETTGVNNGWARSLQPTGGQYKWIIQATAIGQGATDTILPSEWSEQRILAQDGNPGTNGPAMVWAGDWDENTQYSGSENLVQFVIYSDGKGYITRTDAGQIPIGALPTDTDYWNGPIEGADAIVTAYLVALTAYIGNLTVGVIQTAAPPEIIPDPNNDGDRTTIGYQPPENIGDYSDPTSDPQVFSRHGIRQYYPSGRVSVYMGQVNGFEYVDQDEQDQTIEGWAIVAFKDDDGSPIHFKLDSTTEGGVTYVSGDLTPTWAVWAEQKYVPFTTLGSGADAATYFENQIDGTGGVDFLCGAYYEDEGGHVGFPVSSPYWRRTPNVNDLDQRVRLVTASGSNTPAPDGWYFTAGIFQETGTLYEATISMVIYGYRFVDGYEILDWEEATEINLTPFVFTSGNAGLTCPTGIPRVTLFYPYP